MKDNKRFLILLMMVLVLPNFTKAQVPSKAEWVDSIMSRMSLDEKLGQLFTVRAYSKADDADVASVKKWISKYHVGGICFFQGSPKRQVELTNEYQALSKIPMLISIDGEWGLGMRFPESAISFPRQLTLGAIQDNSIIEEFGREVAYQMKNMGIHMNFGPVVDVNNNIKNPVINDRSFGEDKYNVSAKALAYMNGMQNNGLLACAKHFPGHGDTETDSHADLPVIRHTRQRLENIEFVPFRTLADQGISGMMVAHLHMPNIDDRPNRPTTLSKYAIHDILRQDFGYDGLIFTDALEMKALSKNFPSGIAEAEALIAGNDVLLLSEDIEAAFKKIKEYLVDGRLTLHRIDESVRRILNAKYDVGLNKYTPSDPETTLRLVNSNNAAALKARLIEKAITLACDEKDLIPLTPVANEKLASVSIGSARKTIFQERLDSYAEFDHYNTTSDLSAGVRASLLNSLKDYEKIIISIHDMSKSYGRNFGITSSALNFIKEISKTKDVIIVLFGSPYALKNFDDFNTVIVAYEDDDLFQDVTAQSLFGANGLEGKLPVSSSDKYYANLGITRPPIQKFGYSVPERVGLNSEALEEINALASQLMADRSSPGCQILVAKDGKIVWEKAYGHLTYGFQEPVTTETVYDMASMTKVLATTLAVMKLQETGKLSLFSPVDNYIANIDTTNKSGMTLYDMMAHVAGLYPWIPFYQETLEKAKRQMIPSPRYYSYVLNEQYTIPVAKKLFLRTDYRDTIWQKIYSSELRRSKDYRYSDLGLYLAARIAENVSGSKLDDYLNKNFFGPLSLRYTMFNPLTKIPISQIAPSELDDYWRFQEVRGTVHDMGAAMLGGIAGHAGLFTNARESAIIMQMLMNGGIYGGKRYLKPSTILQFTQRHPRSSRRAIGFDMKELDHSKSMNMSEFASEWTFGHTGFTGTAAYADPVHNIVFVFLSNRTYPDMNNNRLNRKDYRSKIQSVIYKALIQSV